MNNNRTVNLWFILTFVVFFTLTFPVNSVSCRKFSQTAYQATFVLFVLLLGDQVLSAARKQAANGVEHEIGAGKRRDSSRTCFNSSHSQHTAPQSTYPVPSGYIGTIKAFLIIEENLFCL